MPDNKPNLINTCEGQFPWDLLSKSRGTVLVRGPLFRVWESQNSLYTKHGGQAKLSHKNTTRTKLNWTIILWYMKPFKSLHSRTRRGEQIHRFVENFERIPNWNIQWGYKFCNLGAIWAALHNSIIKALFGDYRVLARSHRPFAFSFIWH